MKRVQRTPGLFSAMRVGALVGLTLSGFDAAGQTSGNKDITLARPDGTEVRVPREGRLANQTAQDVALGILEFDKQAKSRPPRRRASNPEVADAMRQMAEESRNEALEQLDLTYRTAKITSGPLDSQLLQSAKKNLDIVREIMRTPPPPNLNVHTKISASVPNAILHYCLRGDYKRDVCAWHSYNPGALMPIGRYMFRVELVEPGSKAQDEEVLVLNEPTELVILPIH
jgi:hypothetical protein